MQTAPDYADEDVAPPKGSRETKRHQRWIDHVHATGEYDCTYSKFIQMEHEQLVASCGKLHFYHDISNGSWRWYHQRCKQWRLCDDCLKRRAEEYKAQALTAAAQCHGGLWLSTGFKESENIQEIKDPGEEVYISFPQADGSLLVLHKEKVAGARHVEMPKLIEMDWMTIACTPEKHRIRGTLGRKVIPVSSEEMTVVEIDTVYTNAPIPMQIRVRDEAMHEVGLVDPQTIEEAVEANENIMIHYRNLLLSYGFHGHLNTINRKIKANTIPCWEKYRFYFTHGCEKDPIYRPENYPKGE